MKTQLPAPKDILNRIKKRFRRKSQLEKDLTETKKVFVRAWHISLLRHLFWALLGITVAPIIIFLILRPKPVVKPVFGLNFSNKYATELGLDWQETYLAILTELKPQRLRLVAYWDEIESEQDQYDYTNIKWQLEKAKENNVEVILTVGQKVPRWPECFEPEWWKSTADEKVRNRELLEYVGRTVEELSVYDNIVMWQVENEPFWPFGECSHKIEYSMVATEVDLVRTLDDRPILVQDSGEGGLWQKTYRLGDKLGISMYRKIWYDFWGIFFGDFIYFEYPLAHWTYKIKADFVGVPYKNIIVTELQAEPWGPGINSQLSQYDKDQTMSRERFISTISYAQKSGFNEFYLWGAEWWYWEKELNNNPYFWQTARGILQR